MWKHLVTTKYLPGLIMNKTDGKDNTVEYCFKKKYLIFNLKEY